MQTLATTDLAPMRSYVIELNEETTPLLVAYRVTGPVQGYRLKDQGGHVVGDIEGLVDGLTRHATCDREAAEALFDFVVREMKDWYYPAQGLDLTVEGLDRLVWGFGFGFCYDLGRLQAGLWATAGLRSRIVGWPQHTLAEVYYQGAWHLYDLQHRSFYLKADGDVASFEEIRNNPDLLFQGLNEHGLDAIGYPPEHMAAWYSIAEPVFQDSQDGTYWRVESPFSIDLRADEYFEFLPTEPCVVYHPDSWFQYYGEMTLRKDPPWPIQGRLVHGPEREASETAWQLATTPDGRPAFAIDMQSPYLFTEGWVNARDWEGFARVFVDIGGYTQFVGRMVEGRALFSRYIAGCNSFRLIIEAPEWDTDPWTAGLQHAEVHTRLQLSPIGLPRLRPGANLIKPLFDSGQPKLNLWFMESSPDLAITEFGVEPERPFCGQWTHLAFDISNQGTATSQRANMTVRNNVTAFLAESCETIDVVSIPPLDPGQTIRLNVGWQANTRMTWYGKDPMVQLIDAWVDEKHVVADSDRDNNRLQQYVVLDDGRPQATETN